MEGGQIMGLDTFTLHEVCCGAVLCNPCIECGASVTGVCCSSVMPIMFPDLEFN